MLTLILNLLMLMVSCHSASLPGKTPNQIDVFQKDVAKVGNAIENLTFDVIKSIVTTPDAPRSKRSPDDDDLASFCRRRIEEKSRQDALETQHIKELKDEVKKLKEVIQLLKEQQKIYDYVYNGTHDDSIPTNLPPGRNDEELALLRLDLKQTVSRLNQTRELIDYQRRKTETMADDLKRQQDEIEILKSILAKVVGRTNNTDEPILGDAVRNSSDATQRRASDFSELKKFLDDDSDELETRVLELEKQLKKKRQKQNLAKELKMLEAKIAEEDDRDGSRVLKQLEKALLSGVQSKSDDVPEIDDLSDLQVAIEKLRPKENNNNNAVQFQAMLNKLISRPGNSGGAPPEIPHHNPQPIRSQRPQVNYPYVCYPDYSQSPPPDYSAPKPNFFPVPTPGHQSYYAPPPVAQSIPDKSYSYPVENNLQYQEDLGHQIEGLQEAIDHLNRPEYVQKPEDKAIIEDLDRQIGDLRGVVANLNRNYEVRQKRSSDDNVVESEELVEEMSKLVDKFLERDATDSKSQRFEVIQSKIDDLKNQLGSSNKSSERSAGQPPFYQDYFQPDYAKSSVGDLKKSVKTDFFIDIVSKILDKLIAAIPVIVKKLFNFSFDELSSYDYQDYDMQGIFKNLGIFGYFPIIILRLITGFGNFLKVLKKNSFFKNFLIPVLILGTVAGSILFLIWWLQPDDTAYPTTPYPYTDNYNAPSTAYPQPVYNKGYTNK